MTTALVAGKEVQVKPCPFCGDDQPEVATTMRVHHVDCKNPGCLATGPVSKDRDYAIYRWNRVQRN